ncbi:MAG: TlpA family protein disulfide reductase [Acidobacteria bacterium]|nr:TlpA family protein disulfide reductase [Acidobacteriota bacterium]
MRKEAMAWLAVVLFFCTTTVQAGELVRLVRNKISAGDTASCQNLIEDYKNKSGVDAEYLDAVGWLARGAEMMQQRELAAACVAELRREIREEKADLLSPLGAAIEVEAKLRAARDGRGVAIRFLEDELARAKNISLRSRIRKSINSLSLEGQSAIELTANTYAGAAPPSLSSLKGKPVLLFLWAHWCGDCRGQAAALGRVWKKYQSRGLMLIAPTRLYGTGADGKTATPAEEKAHIEKIWAEGYADLAGVSIPIDTELMVRYGVSATPTFVLIDRNGIVRLYTPTRLSEAELARRIEEVLAEK